MAENTEQLVVLLEARVNQFEKNMLKAAKTANDAFKQIEDGSKRASATFEKAINDGTGSAVQQFTKHTGLARHEMTNLFRQVQDIGVSLASGQSPFTVLVQQGSQVGDIFANTRGTLRGFAGQLAAAITPTVALAGGVAALGTGTVLALKSWKDFALALDDASSVAGLSIETFSKLQAAASFKGVGSEDFTKGMTGLAAQLYQAKNNAGELRELFRVNGVTINDSADALEKVADLIQGASSYQLKLNILQKAGLPTTAEFVRFMDQGGAKIRQAQEEAAKFGGAANREMIAKAREFDEWWNRAWTNFGYRSKQVIAEAAEGFSNLGGKGSAFALLMEKLETKPARFQSAFKNRPTVTVDENGSTVNATPTVDPDAIRVTEQYTDALKRQVDQQRIELAVQGMSADKAAAYRALQEQLLDAKYRHIQLSPEQIAALEKEAGALGALTRATDSARASISLLREVQFERAQLGRSASEQSIASRLRAEYGDDNYMKHMNDAVAGQMRLNQQLLQTKDLMETALSGFLNDLADGKSAVDALNSALKGMERTLINAASNAAISAAFGAIGLPVAIRHSGSGPGDRVREARYVDPTVFINAPRYHSGIGPGEQAAVIRDDESVLTPGQMRALGRQISGKGGNALTNNISVSVTMPAGANREDGARFGAEVGRQIVAIVQNEMIKQMRYGGMLRSPA